MLSILAPIIVFGLVIFVHELGHFLAAKAVGVYAPRFSIGFGPALWKRRRGETEYVIAAFPLGGYVRMASRHDAETAFLEGGSEEASKRAEADPEFDPDAMIPFGPKPVPEHRWFESKGLPARLFIMLAGVTMNMILALVVAIGLSYYYGRIVVPTQVVGTVRVLDNAPDMAALQPGDTILRVNQAEVGSWNDVRREMVRSRDAMVLTTQRGEIRIGLENARPEEVAMAIDYHVPPVLDQVIAGGRAADAGLQPGDSLVAIQGERVRNWSEVVGRISASPEQPLVIALVRGGARETVTVTPTASEGVDPATGERGTVGRIGVAVRDVTSRESVGIVEATEAGGRITWAMTTAVVGFLRDLVGGQVSVRQLGGPIAITRASVTAARSGVEDLFYLIALLSINVAILNLLPIPILDGGQIIINVIESAKGSPFSLRTREYILRFGLLAILMLFAVVMFNDIRDLLGRLVGGWFGGG
jgi:regulator of sigma E protease